MIALKISMRSTKATQNQPLDIRADSVTYTNSRQATWSTWPFFLATYNWLRERAGGRSMCWWVSVGVSVCVCVSVSVSGCWCEWVFVCMGVCVCVCGCLWVCMCVCVWVWVCEGNKGIKQLFFQLSWLDRISPPIMGTKRQKTNFFRDRKLGFSC